MIIIINNNTNNININTDSKTVFPFLISTTIITTTT